VETLFPNVTEQLTPATHTHRAPCFSTGESYREVSLLITSLHVSENNQEFHGLFRSDRGIFESFELITKLFAFAYVHFSGDRNFSLFFFIHLFICAYIVWAVSPPCPPPPPSPPPPPRFQAEPILPFSPILLKRRHKQ
jgi:hypothetical protein